VDDRYNGRPVFQDHRRSHQEDARGALRDGVVDLGKRSRQEAQPLGNGSPTDLLGTPAPTIRVVSERAGLAGASGRELLDYIGLLFDYWHDYKAGKLSRETFVS